MGYDYIGNNKIGKKIHNKRMKMEKVFYDSKNSDLKRQMFDIFAEIGLGRELTIVGRKQSD